MRRQPARTGGGGGARRAFQVREQHMQRPRGREERDVLLKQRDGPWVSSAITASLRQQDRELGPNAACLGNPLGWKPVARPVPDRV